MGKIIALQFRQKTGKINARFAERIKNRRRILEFLGGEGTYEILLDIFERVGIELRPEINEYFLKFNLK